MPSSGVAYLGETTSMRKTTGFTLIELMVVIAIAAILATMAAPSFIGLIQSSRISTGVNTFLADTRLARSESVRLGGDVIMCRSNAPEAANPVCDTGSGPGGNGWVSGWIIFHDLDNSLNRNGTEPVLRVQPALTSIDSITESGTPSNKFPFTATGRLRSLPSATTLQFGGAGFANSMQRVVCVGLGGRARIAGDGNASCGTDQ
jgi:type IV fimbrial biogenesis protein FimT